MGVGVGGQTVFSIWKGATPIKAESLQLCSSVHHWAASNVYQTPTLGSSDTVCTNMSTTFLSSPRKLKFCTTGGLLSWFIYVFVHKLQFPLDFNTSMQHGLSVWWDKSTKRFGKDDEIFRSSGFKQGFWIIWVNVHCSNDPSLGSKESSYCDSTSMVVEQVHADVLEALLAPVWVSEGATHDVCVCTVVTPDSELWEEESVDAAAADVVVGTGMTAGVALMLIVTPVAMITPSSVVAAYFWLFLALLQHFPPFSRPLSQTGVVWRGRRRHRRVSGIKPAGGGWRRLYEGGAAWTEGWGEG